MGDTRELDHPGAAFQFNVRSRLHARTIGDLHGLHSCPHELCYCVKELLTFLHE